MKDQNVDRKTVRSGMPYVMAGLFALGSAFAGGLDADMPATLFRFEGPDKAVAFTPAAVAESGVRR